MRRSVPPTSKLQKPCRRSTKHLLPFRSRQRNLRAGHHHHLAIVANAKAVAGKLPLVASPMRFSETPIKHEIPPPAVGQHTDEILRSVLKKSDAQIAGLRSGGVV